MGEPTSTDSPGQNESVSRVGVDRRDFLKLGSTLMVGTAAGGVAVGRAQAAPSVIADPAPEHLEVGGGTAYDRTVSKNDATIVVSTKDGLLTALDDATAGDVVYVDDSATIDLTGVSNVGLATDVTLASGRGNGSAGALLYTSDYPSPLFKVYGDRVRFTGLRIRGPRWDYFTTSDYDANSAQGIWFLGDDGEVENCQLYGWPYAAVAAGARSYTNSIHVHHCSIHNNQLEGLGYGVDLLNGHSLVEHCYFDRNRHSIDGFGYETNGYEARYNLVGPNPVSHAFDMHNLSENLSSGADVAGGTIKIHHNTFQFTEDQLGRGQEAVTIRGVPADGAYVEKNWFYHPERPDGTNVDANGQAYRQNNLDTDNWQHFWSSGNHFGTSRPPSDIGCPRDRRWRPASAVAKSDTNATADVEFAYPNHFFQELTVTDVQIDPRSDAITRIGDGSMGEGRWASELHIAADVQDGCTDVGGGLALPGSIDLDADGHSSSPDTEAVLSAGSTASVAIAQFQDGNGNAVEMHDQVVHFEVSYRLADGTTGVDTFSTVPLGEGSLKYVGDATALDNGSGARSDVEFGITNEFRQDLTVTNVGIDPTSEAVARLGDGSMGEGRWASELHIAADVQDGCTDVGGGLALPGSIDLDADGHTESPDTEAILSAGSTASVAIAQFQDANEMVLDMQDEELTISLDYRLADGTTGSESFSVIPTAVDGDPAVSTGSPSNVGESSATLAGSLEDLGDATSADVGFEYRSVGASDWTATATRARSSTGGYSLDVSGLASGTEYEFRAVATASDGDGATGTTVSFATSETTTSTPPSVQFSASEAGSPNPHAELTVNWSITDDDGDIVEVVIDVAAAAGSPKDTHRHTYGGSSGVSGSDYFKFKHAGGTDYVVTVTARDAAGNETTPAATTVSS